MVWPRLILREASSHRNVSSDSKHTPHQAPSKSQLFAYSDFQLAASASRRAVEMAGPSSTRRTVSCGGTLCRKVTNVGRPGA